MPLPRPVPKPSAAIADAGAFLAAAGRNLAEHAEALPTWESLFTTTGPQLKAAGLDVQSRRYLLKQVEHYRQHGELATLRQSRKLNGGERKANQHLAKKMVLERIELAKTQKILRKQAAANARLEASFAKAHTELL